MKYRKTPFVIEAMQFDGEPIYGLSDIRYADGNEENPYLTIPCFGGIGVLMADVGDYVIEHEVGNYTVMSAATFGAEYGPLLDPGTDCELRRRQNHIEDLERRIAMLVKRLERLSPEDV